MDLNYIEIGQNIKICRMCKRMKQADLAEKVDVSEQHISHIECGRTKLSLPVLLQISNALDADIYSLLGSSAGQLRDSSYANMIAQILKDASSAQKRLCLQLCRTVVECDDIDDIFVPK